MIYESPYDVKKDAPLSICFPCCARDANVIQPLVRQMFHPDFLFPKQARAESKCWEVQRGGRVAITPVRAPAIAFPNGKVATHHRSLKM